MPYTEHDDENTMSLTPAVSIASTSFTVPVTLLSQYRDGLLHRLADVLVRGEVHDLGDVASVAQLDDEVEVGDVAARPARPR